MKIISPNLHGIIDYLVVVFLWASPTLFSMSGDVAIFIYALGAVHLTLTLLTDYSAGMFKLIPLQLHGLIELAVGVILIILAYTYFNTDHAAHTFYLAFGIAVLFTAIISDYNNRKVAVTI